ncbi:hypothetical protein YC2023_043898 [Brassica napus]
MSPGPELECCVLSSSLICVGGCGTLKSVLAPRYRVVFNRVLIVSLANLIVILGCRGKLQGDHVVEDWTHRPPESICGAFGYGCKALILELAGRVSGQTGLGRRVNFMTLTGSSLARHVALPDHHGVGLDGQSCSCLIVGWPVGLSSPTLGVGHPSVMFLFDSWPVGQPMPRTVRGCFRGGVANALSRKSGRVQSLGRGWIFGVMEDFDVLPSPTLSDLFAPQSFDQVVPDMITTPIIISDDESDDVAVPAPIIIISDDDTESDDNVLEIPSVAPPSPITIWSTGTTGETPSYDPAEDHGPSPPTPEYELETGWLTLFYQPMESIRDSEDDPAPYYQDMMITDDPFTQPIELPHYQPIFETGEPSSFPHTEAAMMELPFPEIIYDIGEPSSFPYMETAMTELPLPQTTYETGRPSSFPAYAPGGSTYFRDPNATKSFPYGQGSEMFTGAEDGYVDPHGYLYHTTTYLGGSDLYPRCFVCGAMGHLTAVCRRYVELLEIPYLPCARPAGGSTEWGALPQLLCPFCCRSPGCDVDTTGAKPAHARHVWGGLVFPRPRIQWVQGNPLFAGSGRLRETGSWPMAE